MQLAGNVAVFGVCGAGDTNQIETNDRNTQHTAKQRNGC